MPGVGRTAATSLSMFFHSVQGLAMLDRLAELGFACMIAPQEDDRPKPLTGLTVVVTGTLKDFDRHTIKECIRSHGGSVSESVGKKTSMVLVGDGAGSKATKAASLGVRCITEEEFKEMLA